MEAFEILGDPVRRRILELLATGERAAGEVVDVVQAEFGLSQPAVSRQLRVLRESGFAGVRPEGTRRLYVLRGEAFDGVEGWLADLRRQWGQRLDALETELARGTARRPRRTPKDEAPLDGRATRNRERPDRRSRRHRHA